MFRDLTLGQYYPVRSVIHSLDPRTKLAGTLLFIVSLFVAKGVPAYAVAALFLAGCIRLSRVPLRYMLKGLRAIFLLLSISIVFNLFLTEGELLFRFWIFKITKEGLVQAGRLALRLVLLVMGSSMMTYTTTPTSLTDGIERGLGFLRVVKVPVHEVAMMMSIALRFIPILTEESDKIMKAQMARGADFESGNLMQRAKALVPVLVPLFVSAFRRATELAMAMEARCYHGGDGRTKMYPLQYGRSDRLAYALCFAYLGAILILRFVPIGL